MVWPGMNAGARRVRLDYPTLRKEREGSERVPREEQMFSPAVAAWGTRRLVAGMESKSDKSTL